MSNKKEKIIIIDGNALIHRSFHALPPTLRTKEGVLVNAVYGFSSFLLKALIEFKPNYLVLTLDKKGPTFRHEVYNDYKATRVKAPDELYEQIPIIKQVAKAFDIPIFELSGYEADDLIGSLCNLKEIDDLEKIIITGDLDTLQLVNKRTKVYTMSRGLSDSILYDEDRIIERYGFGAKKIIDYKALRGDPSDNIPGVKSIGEKTATELLLNFDSLEEIYQSLDSGKIKEKTVKLLENGKKEAFLSQKLATIDINVPIAFKKEDTRFKSLNNEKVFSLFTELGFRSLLGKVKMLNDTLSGKSSDKLEDLKDNNEEAKGLMNMDCMIVKDDKDLGLLIKKINSAMSINLKTITKTTTTKEELLALVLSFEKNKSYLFKKELIEKIKNVLEDENIKKIGHDLKNDYRLLKEEAIKLQGLKFDLMLASYLLNPSHAKHDLNSLAFNELGIYKKELKEKKEQLSLGFELLDWKKISLEAARNCALISELKKILEKKIIKEKLVFIFEEIEMPLIEVLGEMETNGILFNSQPIKLLEKNLSVKIRKLEKDIYQLAKEEFNINSTKQLKEILFEKLALPTAGIKKTKTGFSTADDELEKLLDTHVIIPKIRNYRELNKLITTYIKPLPEMINPKTKRIHTHFNQAITATGRLSSTEPNLQNIPARTKEGEIIRQAFGTDKGWLILGLDYSQIELRIAAHLSGDKKMLKAFLNNKDIHQATAAEINDVKLVEVTKKMRQEAKATNFGILYGQGPHGLSRAANIPYQQAREFIKKYFLSYPGIKKMMDTFIKSAEKNSYSITFLGRKRPLAEINSSIPMIKKAAERVAINAPIQGAAADIIKLAMIKIHELIKSEPESIKLLLQVHDELIFEVKKDKLDHYLIKIKKIMEDIVKLKVPLIVKGVSANNWGDLK